MKKMTTSRNYIIGAVVLVVLVILGWWMTRPSDLATFPEGFKWEFVSAGMDEKVGAPKTQVTLISPSGKKYEAGTYYGTCFDITTDSKWTIDLMEKSAVVCWWAGVGNEIGIWKDGEKWVMKAGDLEEPTAETAAKRGNFREIQTLK